MTCLPIRIKHTLLELVLLFYCVISYICSTFSFRLPHSGRHRALLLPSSRWQCGVSRPVLWVVTSTLLLNSLELVLPRWEWLDLALELERCSGALLLVMPGTPLWSNSCSPTPSWVLLCLKPWVFSAWWLHSLFCLLCKALRLWLWEDMPHCQQHSVVQDAFWMVQWYQLMLPSLFFFIGMSVQIASPADWIPEKT